MAHKPLQGLKLAAVTLSLSLGTFIQVLDTSIANVSIPNIAGDLGVSSDDGTWVITSFSVSNAIVLPLTGWLSDFFGQVRLFVLSVILFAVASLLCGLSPNLGMLIFFRVAQGAVAGTLIPLSQSLLLNSYPVASQGLAMGFWAMVVIVAPVLGPILGGWLTFDYGWPWIFYINVPIGIFSALVSWTILKNRESDIVRNRIDYFGLFLLALGVATLQILLDKGQDLDWFNSNFIWIMAITSFISLAYFVVWDLYTPHPIVNFKFFKDRNFTIGVIGLSVGYLIFFGSTVLLPLWLQTVQGYTPLWAGYAVAPIGIIPLILTPIYGKFSNRVDGRLFAALSFFIFSMTFFWYSNFISDISFYGIALPRLLQGLGVTFFFIPLTQISLMGIAPKDYASASGISNFFRILAGGGFGTSIFVTVWERQGVRYHSWLSEKVTDFSSQTNQFYELLQTQLNLEGRTADAFVDTLMAQQASVLSLDDVFWISGWLFLAMIPLVFFCRKSQGAAVAHAAE